MKFEKIKTKIEGYFSETNQIKRIVIYAAIALGLAVVSFAGYYYWDRYVKLGDQSPISRSISELEELVRQHPDDTELRMALAESYLVDRSYSKAMAQASEVLISYPDNDRAMFVVGISAASEKQWEQAVPPLEKFVEIRSKASTANLDTSLETALYFLGSSYINLNRYQDAVSALSQAVKINATDADAFYLLGRAYTQNGQHEEAILSYGEAVRFVPDFVEAYQGMAESYTALGKTDYASYARGMVSFSMKDYEAARVELEKAIQSLTNFVPAYIGLGLTYEELGDLKSAEASLITALQIEPDNFTASQALGRVQAAIGN
jgi:tetratricopeptide (TPR) repeat protein